ncbi:hypothetical protein EVAR_53773_1 [Eumeta japonica]|uniref:Uncharacterized protein n=1 Tax=Eumeta variegata TaxID=151549 RepID=A0A4C1Z6T5_EUMVA|nr:hypothetical protein EVAR_53773_1 [Eumeta japonica]
MSPLSSKRLRDIDGTACDLCEFSFPHRDFFTSYEDCGKSRTRLNKSKGLSPGCPRAGRTRRAGNEVAGPTPARNWFQRNCALSGNIPSGRSAPGMISRRPGRRGAGSPPMTSRHGRAGRQT